MFGRFFACVALTLCCVSPKTLSAQYAPGMPAPPNAGPGQQTMPYGGAYAPVGYGGGPSYGAGMPQGAYGGPQGSPYGDVPCPDCYGGDGNIQYEALPDDKGWAYDTDSPLDKFLKNFLQNNWLRLGYMNWDLGSPGAALLGAPLQGIADPSQPFPLTVGGLPVGNARVPDLGGVSMRGRNGIKAVLGIPLTFGVLESNIFAIEKTTNSIDEAGLPSNPIVGAQSFLATSTLTNGQIGSNILLYDESFTSAFTSRLWGTEANLIIDSHAAADGLRLLPLVGFKYLNQSERVQQTGVFSQFGQLATPQVSVIDTKARNYVYAPQLGMRLEYVNPWFSVGATPVVGFGINDYQALVRTEQIRSAGEAPHVTTDDGKAFSPMFALEVLGRVNLHKNFSVFISYDLMVVAKFARPQSSTRYDDFGVGAPLPGITAEAGFDNITYHGLTVGGEFRFK